MGCFFMLFLHIDTLTSVDVCFILAIYHKRGVRDGL